MKLTVSGKFFAVVLVTAFATTAQAAVDYSKERTARMKSMDSAVNEILNQTGGLFRYEEKTVLKKLDVLRTELSRIPETFPAGSESDATKANIWTDASGFADAIQSSLDQVERLAKAVADKDKKQVRQEAKGLQKQCRACHGTYREDEY